MYGFVVKRIVRRILRRLSQGDYEPIVRQFGPQSRFVFSGDHALGGERRGQDAVRHWFQQMLQLFPGFQIVPQNVIVNGWPWNTVIANHFVVTAPRTDGREYRNEGMQLLRLRWGRVVEDLIFEDTQKLVAELRDRERQGFGEAVPASGR
jgi:ketosteroid isomerase-like protein